MYLWATLGIWLVNMLGRVFFKSQAFRLTRAWPSVFSTQLTALPGGMTRADVFVPAEMKWKPGQHCYLRFPGLAIWDNHPFTVASFPTSEDTKEKDGDRRLTFFIRAQEGFTKKLATSIQLKASTSTHVWVDGPYGGVSINDSTYDTITLIAGGSGITACLSWLSHLTQEVQSSKQTISKISLVWIVRQKAHTNWISAELEAAKQLLGSENLAITFYVTDTPRELKKEVNSVKIEEAEKGVAESENSASDELGKFHEGRPFIPAILPTLLGQGRNFVVGMSPSRALVDEKLISVAGCGPESLKIDVSNACALAQGQVLRGEVQEVRLLLEDFGWG